LDDFNLIKYFDLEFVGDKENGVSNSGYHMSHESIVVSCRSHKQSVPTYSTIEAEYVETVNSQRLSGGRRNLAEVTYPTTSKLGSSLASFREGSLCKI
jgi:hypothetical protein